MKKISLTFALLLSLLSFANNKMELREEASCEEVVTSSIEMYEELYGCMDSDTYTTVYENMMASWC